MQLAGIGVLFFSIGVLFLFVHYLLELSSMLKIKKWLKKHKAVILQDEYILKKYESSVLNSEEYKQLKELSDENLFLVKTFARVGMNYTDFLFFQGLIEEYQKKAISMSDENDIFNKVKKLIWIIFSFEISLFAKKIGFYMVKLSVVYFIVLFVYERFINN